MEFLSIFLGSFTALADRIEKLKKTKFQDNKDFFNEIIKPMFMELEPVASNYMSIFRNAKKSLNKKSLKKLREILESVAEEREAMLLARIKVEQMAKQIKEYVKDDEVGAFASAVLSFFYGATTPRLPSRTIFLIKRLKQIEENTNVNKKLSEEDKLFISVYVENALGDLEKHWNEIVQSYEKIKIYSTAPKKFVKQ